MSQVSQLYQLQLIDNEIRAKTLRLREVLQLQKGNKELEAAKVRMETAVSDLTQWQTKHKDLSLELDGLNNNKSKIPTTDSTQAK